MSFRDVDLATIEVLSAALVRGGPWTHNIGAGVDGVLMGLVNHGWSGPAATAMIRRWKLQKPAQEATSSARRLPARRWATTRSESRLCSASSLP